MLDPLRQPEYTGENRCIPCTMVNLVIAAILGVTIAVISIPIGIAAFALSIVAIYLRGYLVPGTPALTKQYLPDRIHRYFDHHPLEEEYEGKYQIEEGSYAYETLEEIEYHRENEVDEDEYLLEAGVFRIDEEINDIRLTDAFLQSVDEHLAKFEPGEIDLADVGRIYDEEPEEVQKKDRDYPAYRTGYRVRKWPSEAALRLDLAADAAMREFADDWPAVPLEQRHKMRKALRFVREHCPDCGTKVVLTEDTVESCCGEWDVSAVVCETCDVHFGEMDPKQIRNVEGEAGITPD